MRLATLPNGITGFRAASDELPSVDPRAFKEAAYLVSRRVNGHVQDFDLNLRRKNFLVATIQTRDAGFCLLCNSVHPFVACVPAGDANFGEIHFVECDILEKAFEALTEFKLLDAEWLESDVNDDLVRELGSAEHAQLTYWRSVGMAQRVGDLIFNHWD